MYQTVGQDAIALVVQALDVPLYRRVIQGHPVEQTTEYGLKSAGGGGIAGDETEDLYALLSNVLVCPAILFVSLHLTCVPEIPSRHPSRLCWRNPLKLSTCTRRTCVSDSVLRYSFVHTFSAAAAFRSPPLPISGNAVRLHSFLR